MSVSLSGVTPLAEIAIFPGRPLLSIEETNRLLRQQGVCLALAQGYVFDQVVATITLDSELESKLMGYYLQQQGVGGYDELDGWLERKGWSTDDLRYFATKAEKIRHFSQRRYGAEAEIRFLDRKLDLDQVTYSMLRVSDPELAEELFLQLKEGEQDFASLVATYSEGAEKVTRGLIGPIAISSGHPLLAERLRVGAPGQLWPPFQVNDVWLVVRLEDRFPAQLDEAMRQTMVDELFGIWFNEQVALVMAGENSMPLPQDPDSDVP